MYKFGKGSLSKLESVHHDLVKILKLAITRTPVDFGISEGHRSIERQNELYNQGKSKIDGINKKGKHNYNPSLAVDIYAYHPDLATRKKLAYDVPTLCLIAGVIIASAEELKAKGEVNHSIRWGGNWDNDGVILYDQSFDDLPHFELV